MINDGLDLGNSLQMADRLVLGCYDRATTCGIPSTEVGMKGTQQFNLDCCCCGGGGGARRCRGGCCCRRRCSVETMFLFQETYECISGKREPWQFNWACFSYTTTPPKCRYDRYDISEDGVDMCGSETCLFHVLFQSFPASLCFFFDLGRVWRQISSCKMPLARVAWSIEAWRLTNMIW